MHEMAKMTANMKTVCVGRFLIDLPANAEFSLNGAFVGGFDISVSDESREQFMARLASRENEINSEPNSLGRKNMESVKSLDSNGFTGKIFTFGRSSDYTMQRGVRRDWVAVKLEAYLHAGTKSFDVIADGYDPARVDNLDKLLSQLRTVPTDTIPTEGGLCFGSGMLLDPISASQAEKIVLFAGLPAHPDVAIAFNTMAGLKRTWPTLLQRRSEADAHKPLWIRSRFTTLRSGPRTINGLVGEEAAVKVMEMNFSATYGFDWELAGSEDDVLEPAIHLEMSTGNNPAAGGEPVQSSLHQEAALELWDKIASSIRIRPTQPSRVREEPPPAGPTIGTIISAGAVCPQSGWWLCGEGGSKVKVLGGERQYIRKGQKMPQALLMPAPTLWQKARGLQPTFENKNPTLWKLADKRLRQRTAPAVPLAQPSPPLPAGATAVPHVEAGTGVKTGAACPISGWWRCQDNDALDGTRWFSCGVQLPAATFQVTLNRGWSARSLATIQRSTVWELVRIDETAPSPSSTA